MLPSQSCHITGCDQNPFYSLSSFAPVSLATPYAQLAAMNNIGNSSIASGTSIALVCQYTCNQKVVTVISAIGSPPTTASFITVISAPIKVKISMTLKELGSCPLFSMVSPHRLHCTQHHKMLHWRYLLAQ